MRKAEVYLHEKLAGHLTQNKLGYTFAYAPAYLATASAAAISLMLPLRSAWFHKLQVRKPDAIMLHV